MNSRVQASNPSFTGVNTKLLQIITFWSIATRVKPPIQCHGPCWEERRSCKHPQIMVFQLSSSCLHFDESASFLIQKKGEMAFFPPSFCMPFYVSIQPSFSLPGRKERGVQACIHAPLCDPAVSLGLHQATCSLFDPSIYKQMNPRIKRWEDRMEATG